MERSDIRGGLTRILRSLSSGRPKAGPGGSIRLPCCGKGSHTALILFGIPKLVRFDKIRT